MVLQESNLLKWILELKTENPPSVDELYKTQKETEQYVTLSYYWGYTFATEHEEVDIASRGS